MQLNKLRAIALSLLSGLNQVSGQALNIPGASLVEFYEEPLLSLPEPEVVSSNSANRIGTPQWVYKIPDPATGDIVEEFTIVVIDNGIDHEDPAAALHSPRSSPASLFVPRSDLERRAWTCEWWQGCEDAARWYLAVTAAEVSAATQRFKEHLKKDNYKVVKSTAKGYIEQFTIGILSNIAGFYIGNKLQDQDTGKTDACAALSDDIARLEAKVDQLTADFRHFMELVKSGATQPRGYAHLSHATVSGDVGTRTVHTCKLTDDQNDYKSIGGCDLSAGN